MHEIGYKNCRLKIHYINRIDKVCYWGHVMPGLGTPKVKMQVIDLEHLIDVPIEFARAWGLSSALERAHWRNEIRPAARWRLARRARWLAGRARASSQSQNSGSCMHDLI